MSVCMMVQTLFVGVRKLHTQLRAANTDIQALKAQMPSAPKQMCVVCGMKCANCIAIGLL